MALKLGRSNWLLLPALGALAAAWLPPLRTLANGFLFSAHMLQHLLLQLVVPPLFLLSLPATGDEPGQKLSPRLAVAAWLAGVGAMWIWHAPALCNAVVHSQSLRLVQYGVLLLMGVIFWMPVAGPRRDWRLPPLLGIFYLFSACLGCTVLGIIITFAPPGLYTRYFNEAGAGSALLGDWQLSPADDQRLGGLLMWVPACLVYMTGILSLLFHWYGTPETADIAIAPHHT